MITADKVFKGSTEIIRIYKGTTLEWEKSVPIPDADAYIQDGLVFQLDGIDKGNVEGAWVDRKAGRQFTLNNCIVNSDNIEFNGTDSEAIDNDNYTLPTVPKKYTIEVVLYYGGGSILTQNKSSSSSSSSNGSPMMVALSSTINYLTIGRNLYAVEALPKNKYMCLQAQPRDSILNTVQVNYNGDVLASRQGTIDETFYANGWPSVGCVWTSYTSKASHLLGKVYSIRLYNRLLTEEELYNNMVVDYMRFKIPIMDEFKINLTNDLGEKINKAQFIINNTLFNSTEAVYVPKSSHYFIQFNNIKNHTAPSAILDPKSKNISATYHYTGFEGMIFEATVTDDDKAVSLPFYNAIQVDWGDGTSSTSRNHTYSASGTYTIKLLGNFTNVVFYNMASNIGKNVTKILQFPYNITISNGYMSEPNLTYLAPLIANKQIRVSGNASVNYIDCYSGIPDITSGETNSSYIDREGGYPKYSKDIDTLVLTRDNTTSQTSLQSIQHLYKCTKSSDSTNFYESNSTPPYLSTISKFTNIRYMEIPEEFWQVFGNSINWDFSALSYWGTEGNKQSVVNSLVNNTVDLVSGGYKSQTITLSSATKALLTSDEIAQITAKGYTIA